MYFLAIEIHNIRQLSRLKPSAVESLERALDGLMVSNGLTAPYRDSGLYLFAFEHVATGDLASLASASVSAHRLLKDRSDELMGFLLFLEQLDDGDLDRALAEVRRSLRSVDLEDELIVGDSARASLSGLLRVHEHDRYTVADGLGQGPPPRLTELARFVRQPALYEPVLGALESFFDEDAQPGIVLVHGPRFSGKRQNLAEAIARLVGTGNTDHIVRLYPSAGEDSPLAPFLNGLRSVSLDTVPAYLSRIEREVWNGRREMLDALLGRSRLPVQMGAGHVPTGHASAGRVAAGTSASGGNGLPGAVADLWGVTPRGESDDQYQATDARVVAGTENAAVGARAVLLPLSDSPGVDLLVMYGLLLKAVIRMADEVLAPAVIVFEEVHSYSSESLKIAADLLREYLPGGRLLPILVSRKPYLPSELREFPFSKLRIPSVDPPLLDRLIGEFMDGDPSGRVRRTRLQERTSGRVVSIFHHLRSLHGASEDALATESGASTEVDDTPGLDAIWGSVLALESGEQQVLYAVHVCSEILGVPEISRIADELEVPAIRVPEILRSLSDLGLVNTLDRLRPGVPELERRLEAHLGPAAVAIKAAASREMYHAWKEQAIPTTYDLFLRLHGAGMQRESREVFDAYVRNKLERRDFHEAYRLLYQDLPLDEAAASRVIVSALRLRLALLSLDRHSANEAYRDSRDAGVSPVAETGLGADEHAAELILQQSAYLAATGDFAGGLRLAKRAIMQFQDVSNLAGLSAAHCEFGLMTLAQGDIQHARDYFVIALGSASETRQTTQFVRASTMEAVALFLYGNHSRVLERLDKLDDITARCGMRDWSAYLALIRGRVLFDLGRYSESLNHFQQSLTFSQLYGLGAAHSVFLAWVARSLVYLNDFDSAARLLHALPEREETLLFQSELYERSGDLERCVDCLDRALALREDAVFIARETPTWRDGFADIEHLSVPLGGETVLRRLVRSFHGYVVARSGRLRDGIGELYALTRKEGLSMVDPYNGFHYFLYSSVLPGTRDEGREPSMEDRLTVLGKSVKHLQERSSRIDDHAHKTAYLHDSYWNGLLYDEARQNNLV